MRYNTPTWRAEKTERVIISACRLLRNKQATPEDIRVALVGIIENASKILCGEHEETHSDNNRWSPELVRFLVDHPERAEDTLSVIASEDYRDCYYDNAGGGEP